MKSLFSMGFGIGFYNNFQGPPLGLGQTCDPDTGV